MNLEDSARHSLDVDGDVLVDRYWSKVVVVLENDHRHPDFLDVAPAQQVQVGVLVQVDEGRPTIEPFNLENKEDGGLHLEVHDLENPEDLETRHHLLAPVVRVQGGDGRGVVLAHAQVGAVELVRRVGAVDDLVAAAVQVDAGRVETGELGLVARRELQLDLVVRSGALGVVEHLPVLEAEGVPQVVAVRVENCQYVGRVGDASYFPSLVSRIKDDFRLSIAIPIIFTWK